MASQLLHIGSKITAIMLNWWILPIGGVSLGGVCAFTSTQVHKVYSFYEFLHCTFYNQILTYGGHTRKCGSSTPSSFMYSRVSGRWTGYCYRSFC